MPQFFENAEAAADYQAQRELQVALRVQQMAPHEFSRWLKEAWGDLQGHGNPALARNPDPVIATARCFGTQEEKNHYDEQREIEQALLIGSRRGLL